MKNIVSVVAVAFGVVAFGAHAAPPAHAAPVEPPASEARPPAPKVDEEARPADPICIDLPWGPTICCTPRSCVSF